MNLKPFCEPVFFVTSIKKDRSAPVFFSRPFEESRTTLISSPAPSFLLGLENLILVSDFTPFFPPFLMLYSDAQCGLF